MNCVFEVLEARIQCSASSGVSETVLLSRFDAPLQASLARTLRHSGRDAFNASLLDYMVHRSNAFYYFNGRQLTRMFARGELRTNALVKNALNRSSAVMLHRFPETVGAATFNVRLPAAIDWNAAPSGINADDFIGALNRHAFWGDLGIAYRYSQDPRYVRELIAQLQSWSNQNSIPRDVDSANSSPIWSIMGTADRIGNWIFAYNLVLGAPAWTAEANTLFLTKLWEQAEFLARVPTASYRKNRTTNHAAALQEVGMLFPEFSSSAAWEKQGIEMTFRCLDAQFYPDGGHIEETPAYARTALNSFVGNILLGKINGRTYWNKPRRRQFRVAVEALFQMLSPDGDMPGISDTYRNSNVGAFFTSAALALGDWRFAIGAPTLDGYLLRQAHPELLGAPPDYLDRLLQRGSNYALSEAGYYMMRGKEDWSQVIVDAGPTGYSHGHFDLLSFEFEHTSPYIPDPGPYRYDNSPQRAYAVSTPAHNTISIDGLSHEAVEGARNPKIEVDEFTSTAQESRVTAHHHAYEYLKGQPTVGRTVWMDRTSHPTIPLMIVIDWARSGRNVAHRFSSSLNLNALAVKQIAPGIMDVDVTHTYKMRVQTLLQPGQTTSLNDTIVTDSPPPNHATAAKRYAVSQTGTSALFTMLISEYTNGGYTPLPPASIALDAPLKKGQPVRIALTMPDGVVRHLVFPPPNLAPL